MEGHIPILGLDVWNMVIYTIRIVDQITLPHFGVYNWEQVQVNYDAAKK